MAPAKACLSIADAAPILKMANTNDIADRVFRNRHRLSTLLNSFWAFAGS